MTVSSRCAVIVVGAGPIGLTMANVLGKAGVDTLLIERNPALSDLPKALNVDDEFYRLIETLGLGPHLDAHGIGPIDFEYRSPLGFRVGYVHGRITEHNYPTRTATYQPAFEAILLDGARAHPSVAARFSCELVAITEEPGGLVAHVRGPDGSVSEVEAQYLVAADGGRSEVRKLLGITFDQVGRYRQRHVVVDVADDRTHNKVALTQLGFRRNLMDLPLPGGRRYELSVRRGEDETELMQHESLRRLLAPFVELNQVRVIRAITYTFQSRLASSFRVGRVFLAGDAAHLMPVFGSQGMNSGARDAKNLGWKLAAVLSGLASPLILDSYEAERRPQVVETINMALRNGQLQSVRRLPVTLARDLLLGVLGVIPPVRRFIRDMRYVPPNTTRSNLVLGERGAAGLPIPNPTLVGGAKLDDRLGPGFALVAIATGAWPGLAGQQHPLWARLGATRVVLRPKGATSAGEVRPDAITVADEHFDRVFASDPGRWLLVRPDRIVAASVSFDGLGQLADQYAKRLGAEVDVLQPAA
jgi:3-(3-hydroxy-phenyl)propionate hydroxylase